MALSTIIVDLSGNTPIKTLLVEAAVVQPVSAVLIDRGPRGLVGPQGAQGIQGDPGETGPPGTTTWDGITDKPTTFPPSEHAHDYLPLAGGSISGQMTIGSGYNGLPAPTNGLIVEGRLGVGTSNPSTKLHVSDATSATARVESGSRRITLNSFSGDWNYNTAYGAPYIVGTQDSNPLLFYTNNVERARVTQSGDLGIGTNAPSQKLHVVGNAYVVGYLNIATTGSNTFFGAGNLLFGGAPSDSALRATNNLTFSAGGNVECGRFNTDGDLVLVNDLISSGTENVMPNQTLAGGDASVMTRGLSDLRYRVAPHLGALDNIVQSNQTGIPNSWNYFPGNQLKALWGADKFDANNAYVVPEDGMYQAQGLITFANVPDGTALIVGLYKNGSLFGLMGRGTVRASSGTVTAGFSGAIMVPASAGDQLRLAYYAFATPQFFNSIGGYIHFSVNRVE